MIIQIVSIEEFKVTVEVQIHRLLSWEQYNIPLTFDLYSCDTNTEQKDVNVVFLINLSNQIEKNTLFVMKNNVLNSLQ